MHARTTFVLSAGMIAAAAVAQNSATPVESKTTANAQAAPAAPATRPAPTPTAAPGADPRTAPPANGTAPIEPKR